jgi:orotate phosphoribosyltransferase
MILPEERERLLAILKERSVERGTFVLASGKTSNIYFDGKQTTLHPEGAYLVGKILFEMLRDAKVDAVGGMTLGADPIVTSIALTSFMEGKPIPAFIIRKEPKKHGKGLWLEGKGNLSEGSPVAIIEDVVTTGKTTLEAIARAEEEGLKVVKVLAVVDREEGGREALAKEGLELEAIFKKSDIM